MPQCTPTQYNNFFKKKERKKRKHLSLWLLQLVSGPGVSLENVLEVHGLSPYL
jgi:hypothetical protein